VSFRQSSDGQAHTLFAPDEHSKRQWMAALRFIAYSNTKISIYAFPFLL
jgi:hypothetical protein